MILAASLLLAASVSLPPATGLRVYNPHDSAATATVFCAGTMHELSVGARDVVDLAGCAAPKLDAPVPLVLFETSDEDGVETQRVVGTNETCPSFSVHAPLFGCKLGTATVAVPYEEGATYSWTVEGAVIVSGQGTPRLVLTLGEGPSVRATASVTGSCTATAEAVIAVRNPIVIDTLEVPDSATADTPTIIRWSYVAGSAPASQMLTGNAFDAPVVLDAAARSYTWHPHVTGSRDVQLRASHRTSIPVEAPKRRRAVGPSRESATECPSARADRKVDVRGCSALTASIEAPASVEAGTTFSAAVSLRAGETVRWAVTDGTLLSEETEEIVSVQASDDDSVEVTLIATVASGPSCSATAEARVALSERAICKTSPPSVVLSVEGVSCDFATVKATFSGTPPFRGTWSDGALFETQTPTLLHDFRTPTTYSVRNFRDAFCAGNVGATARVTHFGPTVSVTTVGGTCPGATAVATFTGTPPFTGAWLYGEWFTTNETRLERPNLEAGTLAVDFLWDASCPQARATSNRIAIGDRGTAKLRDLNFCTSSSDSYRQLHVDMFGGAPPFTVYWSDGVVTTGGPQAWTVTRQVNVLGEDKDFTIERVAGKTCDAVLNPERTTVHIDFRKSVSIEGVLSTMINCLHKVTTAKLNPGLEPGAVIHWSLSSGQIVSGQGTDEITFVQDHLPGGELSVQVTYPDQLCPSTHKVKSILMGPGSIESFSVEPSVIKIGGTAKVRAVIDNFIEYYSVEVSPNTRSNDLKLAQGVCVGTQGRDCTFDYKDTKGAGHVALLLAAGGPCNDGMVYEIKTLVIEP